MDTTRQAHSATERSHAGGSCCGHSAGPEKAGAHPANPEKQQVETAVKRAPQPDRSKKSGCGCGS